MPQLGILFDTQKLGSGFYGYTAFRILFSTLRAGELSGCSLFHGEVGEGLSRSYCIAVESGSVESLEAVRLAMEGSMARGLMPPESRFLDEDMIQDEHLAAAARVSALGELTDCHSRWLHEAWLRAQGVKPAAAPASAPAQTAAAAAPPAGVKRVAKAAPVKTQSAKPQPPPSEPAAAPESKPAFHLPDKVPFALWWTHHGRRSFALMLAFSIGGMMLPWMGCGVSLCIMVMMAAVVQAVAMQWRLWAEHQLSGEDVLEEVKKAAVTRSLADLVQRLDKPAPQASPLLRVIHALTRSWLGNGDVALATAMLEHQGRADGHALHADLEELRFLAWGVPGTALCCFLGMQTFVGIRESWVEAPKLALAGAVGWLVIQGMRCSISASAERLHADLRRLAVSVWIPLLQKLAPPKPQIEAAHPSSASNETLERAAKQLATELEAMREALHRNRDVEIVDTMAGLRTSIEQLTPVLAGFREPFVLQAVPANAKPRALSATA